MSAPHASAEEAGFCSSHLSLSGTYVPVGNSKGRLGSPGLQRNRSRSRSNTRPRENQFLGTTTSALHRGLSNVVRHRGLPRFDNVPPVKHRSDERWVAELDTNAIVVYLASIPRMLQLTQKTTRPSPRSCSEGTASSPD